MYNRLISLKKQRKKSMIELGLPLILLTIVGFCIGIFISTASGTAATLLIPLLTLGLGHSTPQSIGTSLALDSIIAGTAAVIYIKHKQIDLKSTAVLVCFGIIGSLLGSQFTTSAPETVLKIIIGCFLVFIGFSFARKGVKKNITYLQRNIKITFLQNHTMVSLLILGLIVGTMSGFIGIGGGRIITIILIFILGYRFHQAVGTSLIIMFFIAGTGAISHGLQQDILPSIIGLLSIPVFIGTVLGSMYANQIDEVKLSRIAGIIIFIFGLTIIITAFL